MDKTDVKSAVMGAHVTSVMLRASETQTRGGTVTFSFLTSHCTVVQITQGQRKVKLRFQTDLADVTIMLWEINQITNTVSFKINELTSFI